MTTPVVPLQHEFQINGRVTLTVLGTGLHQSNLTVVTDVIVYNGKSFSVSSLNSGLVSALNTAIKNLTVSAKAVPV
jgi:hypothetical protein